MRLLDPPDLVGFLIETTRIASLLDVVRRDDDGLRDRLTRDGLTHDGRRGLPRRPPCLSVRCAQLRRLPALRRFSHASTTRWARPASADLPQARGS